MSGFLDHAASAPSLTPASLMQGRPLVILAPHPDDETLGCGALLFDAAAQGTPCHVICVTDGTRSHPGSRRWPAPVLAATRAAELRAACAILAPAARVTCLGYPDCAAPDDAQASWAEHGGDRFVAAVERGTVSSTQFHPEKSGAAGARLLGNWIACLH